jgi:hypothetical protein
MIENIDVATGGRTSCHLHFLHTTEVETMAANMGKIKKPRVI